MIDKKKLEELIGRYDRKAERAERNYQETGISRYYTARNHAEDMAEALRAALYASDDHSALIGMKAEFVLLAGRVLRLGRMEEEEKKEATDEILGDIVSFARMHRLIREDDLL